MYVHRLQTLKKPTSLSGPSHFWRCCYGGHPRSLVLAEHSRVSLGDFRVGVLPCSLTPHFLNSSTTHSLTPHFLTSSTPHSLTPHFLTSSTPHSLTPHFLTSSTPHSLTPHFLTSSTTHSLTPHFLASSTPHSLTPHFLTSSTPHSLTPHFLTSSTPHSLTPHFLTSSTPHSLTPHFLTSSTPHSLTPHFLTSSTPHSLTPHFLLSHTQSGQLGLSALVETPSEWLPNKSLISAISPSSHPHQFHISTSHSLLLLDTRQPRWPLLEQSHDLGHAPQVLSTTKHPSVLSEQLVMLSDCSAGESLVFSVATPTESPPFVNFSPHTVATYR